MLRKLFQLNVETGEEVSSFESVKEACAKTRINESSIRLVISGLYSQAGGYFWEWRGVDKRIFKKQETLAIDEYIYLNGLSYKTLSEIVGVGCSSLQEINRRGTCSSKTKEKLIRFGIDPRHRVDPTEYVYIHEVEQPEGFDEYVCDVLLRKKVGVFKCADEIEAKEISDVLNRREVVHYGLQKGNIYCVKYDATI